jgi:hypothetical protein
LCVTSRSRQSIQRACYARGSALHMPQRLLQHSCWHRQSVIVLKRAQEGSMPEVGLVSLSRHAVTIARTVLSRYRSMFSKHQFTQPQLLALL